MALPFTAIAQPKELIPVGNLADVILLKAEDPTPARVTVPNSVLCNCWAYVKSIYPSLPSTAYINDNLSTQGSVAVFYYAKSSQYHYAVVIAETDADYTIAETNYGGCQKGTRTIPKDDPSLLGFFPI